MCLMSSVPNHNFTIQKHCSQPKHSEQLSGAVVKGEKEERRSKLYSTVGRHEVLTRTPFAATLRVGITLNNTKGKVTVMLFQGVN